MGDPISAIKDKVDQIGDAVGRIPHMADRVSKLADQVPQVIATLTPPLASKAIASSVQTLSSHADVIASGLVSLGDAVSPQTLAQHVTKARITAMASHFGIGALDVRHLMGGIAPTDLAAVHTLFQPAAAADPHAFRTSFTGSLGALCTSATTLASRGGVALPIDLSQWTPRATTLLGAIPDPLMGAIGGHVQLLDLTTLQTSMQQLIDALPAGPPQAGKRVVRASAAAGDSSDAGDSGDEPWLSPNTTGLLVRVKAAVTICRSFIAWMQSAFPLDVKLDALGTTGLAGAVLGGASVVANVLGKIGIDLAGSIGVGLEAISLTGLVGGLFVFVIDVIEIVIDAMLALNLQLNIEHLGVLPRLPAAQQ
jgi:hypothetical protein